MPPCSHVARTLVSPPLMTLEGEVDILTMKCAKEYAKAYRKAYGQDPSVVTSRII